MKDKLHIVNIVRDDKFIDNLIKFQDLSIDKCIHEYILVSKNNKSYKRIKATDRIKIVSPHYILQYLKENEFHAVFLHSLVCMPYYLISQIHKGIPVFWFAWGFDMYGNLINIKQLHHKSSICRYSFFMKDLLKTFIQHLLQSILYSKPYTKMYQEAVGRIDYFSGVLPVEYDLAKKNANFRALQVEYYYCDVDALSENITINENRGNILVGNSCDINNNHLDLLGYFNNVDLGERKIILPINYSGNAIYRKIVSSAYKKRFRDSVIVLEEYLPLDQYRNIVNSTSIGIFYHERQQAMGNIELFLLNGGKLFLSKSSVIYKYLKTMGFVVFSIQDDLNTAQLNEPLSNEQRLFNRERWLSLHNLEAELGKLNSLYILIENYDRE